MVRRRNHRNGLISLIADLGGMVFAEISQIQDDFDEDDRADDEDEFVLLPGCCDNRLHDGIEYDDLNYSPREYRPRRIQARDASPPPRGGSIPADISRASLEDLRLVPVSSLGSFDEDDEPIEWPPPMNIPPDQESRDQPPSVQQRLGRDQLIRDAIIAASTSATREDNNIPSSHNDSFNLEQADTILLSYEEDQAATTSPPQNTLVKQPQANDGEDVFDGIDDECSEDEKAWLEADPSIEDIPLPESNSEDVFDNLSLGEGDDAVRDKPTMNAIDQGAIEKSKGFSARFLKGFRNRETKGIRIREKEAYLRFGGRRQPVHRASSGSLHNHQIRRPKSPSVTINLPKKDRKARWMKARTSARRRNLQGR